MLLRITLGYYEIATNSAGDQCRKLCPQKRQQFRNQIDVQYVAIKEYTSDKSLGHDIQEQTWTTKWNIPEK